MRWSLALVLALAPMPLLAQPGADRLREIEAERAAAEKQARQFADQARLIEDRALQREAQAKALGAQMAEAEARLEAAQTRAEESGHRLAVLRDDLARKRAPLARMMAALQRLARRPTLLLVLRPSSIRDFVRLRAMVAGLQPQIDARTGELRADLSEARELAKASEQARADESQARADLADRRTRYMALGMQDRERAQSLVEAAGKAEREATLKGVQASAIGALVLRQDQDRRTLAALGKLQGPALVPGLQPGTAPRNGPRIPVPGRIVAGFGERDAAGGRSRGLTIAPAPGARVVAPLAGKVAFAGPFRTYGSLVILRAASGRTVMVAGMDEAVVEIGQDVARGETIGVAPKRDPRILFEQRRNGRVIHPLSP